MESALTFRSGSSRVTLNEPREPALYDERKPDPEALDRLSLENFIAETRNEPPWRRSSDMDCEYYDGNQLRPDTLGDMEDRGIPPVIVNLTQPIVNAVLGMEAKTRSDWEVTADDKPSEIVAQRLLQELNTAERETQADRAISEAYGGQIKAGLGWVEVGRETDPFRYPYRVSYVHRREIWWDWRARNNDLSDARYLIRRRWFDSDVLEVMLPQQRDLIQYAVNGWAGFGALAFSNTQSIELGRSYEEERATTLEQYEWLDTGRRRCQVFEVWYRKWVRSHVFRLDNNKVIEVDRKNQRHMELIAAGVLSPIPAVFPKVRVSMWIGPHRVSDMPTPFAHRHFPYVPFWGFREDLTGAPYGIIRALRSPQDEVNARRSKLLSLITGRRVIMDDDALNRTYNTPDDVADEVGRADAMIILNGQRKNHDGFRVETNGDLALGQMKTLAENKGEMHEVSGVFPPTIGDPQGGLSGVAIDNLVDQSATTLAEINDNHRFGRRMVGELLLSLIRQDLTHPHDCMVGKGKNAKSYSFNREYFDQEAGCNMIEHSIADSSVRVTLSDVPSTPSYRKAQFAQLAELTKGLPPQVQQFVIDFVVEASDVPKREQIAERLRKALGIPDPNAQEDQPDPAQQQMQQQVAMMQQEHQQAVQELMAKLQPALEEVQRLKVENANKQAEAALALERERTRQAEVAAQAADKQAERDVGQRMELEKLDLERERMEREDARLAAERAQAAPKEEGEPIDAKIAGAMDDVRDMVKALADEIASFEKQVSELKKVPDRPMPEPVKAEDIAKALTQALAPILQRPEKEEREPPAPIVVPISVDGHVETEKVVTFETDADGVPTKAIVKETRRKKKADQ